MNNFYEIPQNLMVHQKNGVKAARKHARWGYWYDTGTGKTLMSLEIGIMHGHLSVASLIRAWLTERVETENRKLK